MHVSAFYQQSARYSWVVNTEDYGLMSVRAMRYVHLVEIDVANPKMSKVGQGETR